MKSFFSKNSKLEGKGIVLSILCHTIMILNVFLHILVSDELEKTSFLFCLGFSFTFLTMITILLIYPRLRKFPFQSVFALIFSIVYFEFFEDSDHKLPESWGFAFYHLLVLELENLNNYELTFPILGIYFISKYGSIHDLTFEIICPIMIIAYFAVKSKQNKKNQAMIESLKNQVSEMEHYKNICFEEIQGHLISFGEKKTEKQKNIFLQMKRRIKGIVKKKSKTLKPEVMPEFYAKIASPDVLINFGDIINYKENFFFYLKSCEIIESNSKIVELVEDQNISRKIQKEENIFIKKPKLIEETKIQKNLNVLDILGMNDNFKVDTSYKILFRKKFNATLRLIKMEDEIIILVKFKENQSVFLDETIKEENIGLKEEISRKDKILASISHDMRTPLNGIMFYIKTAKDIENTVVRNQKLEYALINANLLMFLVSDLLEFSVNRQNNSKISLKITKFLLQPLVEDVLDCLKIETQSKNIQLLVNLEVNNGLSLISDESRLKRVLINLLTNALKFTIEGYVKLNITQLYGVNNNLLKVEVLDTGLGIHPDVIPQLMKPFATFDNNDHKVNKSGIGLGLYICKSIVQLLGPNEEIFIHSEQGIGSKFCFLLYIINNDENKRSISIQNPKNFFSKELEIFHEENAFDSDVREILIKTNNISQKSFYNRRSITNHSLTNRTNKTRKSPTNKRTTNLGKTFINATKSINTDIENLKGSQIFSMAQLNVLIVDDQPFNIMILKEILQSVKEFRFNIDKAFHGRSAYEMFCEKNNSENDISDVYNLIFMDCEMPIMDGIHATKLIREKICKEGFHDVMIVGCTGDYERYEREGKISELLMDDCYGKPISKEDIILVIKKLITKIII